MIKPLFTNIVVAISGSDASILAAKYAIVMAKAYHCTLHAVYVVDKSTVRQLALSKIAVQDGSQDYESSLEANGKRYLSYVEDLAQAKDVKIEKEIRKGAVYTEILAAADEKLADLIILGGWEKDRKSDEIITNSHRYIMMHSKCSVLLVKEPKVDIIYRQA